MTATAPAPADTTLTPPRLEFAGRDFTTAWGNGFHSAVHGRAILPDSLRWLWRGYPG